MSFFNIYLNDYRSLGCTVEQDVSKNTFIKFEYVQSPEHELWHNKSNAKNHRSLTQLQRVLQDTCNLANIRCYISMKSTWTKLIFLKLESKPSTFLVEVQIICNTLKHKKYFGHLYTISSKSSCFKYFSLSFIKRNYPNFKCLTPFETSGLRPWV